MIDCSVLDIEKLENIFSDANLFCSVWPIGFISILMSSFFVE
jgi:hypothetical protein